jgi:type VI secretion system protein ImpK
MTGDHDFDDGDATAFVVPTPGGRGRMPPPTPGGRPVPPRPSASPAGAPVELPVWAGNPKSPLLAPAAPLLALATRVQTMVEQPDVGALRQRIIEAMRGFEKQGLAAGVDPKVLRVGHYALCAFIDEMVQRTPWGQSSGWAKQSIAASFHGNVVGGDQFFDMLPRLQQNPGQFGAVLELMYLCLSLGFEGRLRVLDRGRAEHARTRDSLYATIRELRGDYERELSPHWRGIKAAHRALTASVPLWALGAVAAALLATLYLGLDLILQRDSSAVIAELTNLPPQGKISLSVAAPPAPKVVEPPPVAVVPVESGPSPVVAKMRHFLEREIKEGLVEVSEDRQFMTVRLTGDGMFDSGSDVVKPAYLPTLERIAEALNDESGDVRITGYTDNVQIKRSLHFHSNIDLSLARADSVRAIIGRQVATPARIGTEGRGELSPIATNDTPEGRSRNRRIELILVKAEGAGP